MKLREVLHIIYTDSASERGSSLLGCFQDHSKPKSFILFLRVIRLIPNSSGSVSVDYHLEYCIEAKFWKIASTRKKLLDHLTAVLKSNPDLHA